MQQRRLRQEGLWIVTLMYFPNLLKLPSPSRVLLLPTAHRQSSKPLSLLHVGFCGGDEPPMAPVHPRRSVLLRLHQEPLPCRRARSGLHSCCTLPPRARRPAARVSDQGGGRGAWVGTGAVGGASMRLGRHRGSAQGVRLQRRACADHRLGACLAAQPPRGQDVRTAAARCL